MKAVCWTGKKEVSVESVPDPGILNPRDAIVKISSTAICGSDLHLYNGRVPTMKSGDILGHEFMGEIVEVGRGVKNLKIGDRVVVPFPIACGNCYPCSQGKVSACQNSNPGRRALEMMTGEAGAGIFGYSALYGSYAGGQAEYARVPYADFGPLRIEDSSLPDEKVLFLSDILPTGYQAAEYAEIQPGDTVAIWGCGPVGQFAVRSAFLFGAARVIAIDRHPARLRLAEEGGAETLNYEDTDDLVETLKQFTGGTGPERCIDAVGMEAHGTSIYGKIERGKQAMKLQMDNASVLRQVFQSCAAGGTASIAGVYTGFIDKFPFGSIFGKGLTVKTGQCNVHKYMKPLLDRIVKGEIDPPTIISHRVDLDDAPSMYKLFEEEKDECTKVVLKTA
jgi:threonine dehydrogenase-like Zn-dependent dehydrogenase